MVLNQRSVSVHQVLSKVQVGGRISALIRFIRTRTCHTSLLTLSLPRFVSGNVVAGLTEGPGNTSNIYIYNDKIIALVAVAHTHPHTVYAAFIHGIIGSTLYLATQLVPYSKNQRRQSISNSSCTHWPRALIPR